MKAGASRKAKPERSSNVLVPSLRVFILIKYAT